MLIFAVAAIKAKRHHGKAGKTDGCKITSKLSC